MANIIKRELNLDSIFTQTPSQESLERLIELSQREEPLLIVNYELKKYDDDSTTSMFSGFYVEGYDWKKPTLELISETIAKDKYISEKNIIDYTKLIPIYESSMENELTLKTGKFKLNINAVNFVDIAKLIVKYNDFKPRNEDSNGALEFDEDEFVKYFMYKYGFDIYYSSSISPESMIQPPNKEKIENLEKALRNFYQEYEQLPVGTLFIKFDDNEKYLKEDTTYFEAPVLIIAKKDTEHIKVPGPNYKFIRGSVSSIDVEHGQLNLGIAIPSAQISYRDTVSHLRQKTFSVSLNNALELNDSYLRRRKYDPSKDKEEKENIGRLYVEQTRYSSDYTSIDNKHRIEQILNLINLPKDILLKTSFEERENYRVFVRDLPQIFAKHLGIK